MEGIRKITSDTELREIASAGAGFIIDPSNRWWHVATCPRIAAMTVGQPKWHAENSAVRGAFLEQRLVRYPTARPVRPCTACSEDAAAPSGHMISRQERSPAEPPLREPCIRQAGSGFEVWADECVRNESPAASTAGLLRRRIVGQLRSLPRPDGRVLHAAYGGQRRRGTDVENLLFNNIDQELALFSKPGALGIRFEDLGLTVPPAPSGSVRASYYTYRLAQPDTAFAAVQPGRLICRIPEAVVPKGPARLLAARIWLGVRRTQPVAPVVAPAEHGSFVLRVIVHQLNPAESIKAVVDGATAAMQRDDPGRVTEAMTRLAPLLDAEADELLALATAADAPLGTRSRSGPASRQSLFTLVGPAQIRVTPDDDRCIGAEVITAGNDGPARLSVELYAAKRGSAGTRQAQIAPPSTATLANGG